MSWTTVASAVLILYAVYAIASGRIAGGTEEDQPTIWVYRSKSPVRYWIVVGIVLLLVALLYFNVFHF